MGMRRGGCWPWRMSWMGARAARRRHFAAWIARPCATFVHRYNAEGLAGLFDRPHSGRPRRLTAEQEAEVARWVRQGPKLSEDGVVRWRLVDPAQKIERQFGVRLAERSVGTLVRRLGFRRLSVRPHHPRKDLAAQEAFKKTFPIWSPTASRRTRAASRSRSGGRMKPASASRAR